KPVR
ncbi:AMP-binding enzyme family protein, partial [Vibrio parahaemolyticus VPTS-2010]